MKNPDTRPAASIFLHRASPSGDQVYLARRSPDSSFFPDYYAFIGGTLEDEDRKQSDEHIFQYCVLRELFEETGVLLCNPSPFPNPEINLEEKRVSLIEQETTFEEILRELNASPDYDALHPAGRLLTPDFVPVRYDTRFFAAGMPENQEIYVKKGELTEGDWFSPEDALSEWRNGNIKIAPPQVLYLRTLRDLGIKDGLDELADFDTSKDDREPYIEIRHGLRFLPLKTPTLPPARTVNTCVVGHDPFAVVDPGTPNPDERKHLARLLDRMISNGGQFHGVLLTHHHPDHVAAAGWLRDRYDIPICAHEKTKIALDNNPTIDRLLKDGDKIETNPGPVSTLHTPGHTAGHISFLVEPLQTLLAGDVVAGMGTVLIDPPEGDMTRYMETLKRLTQLELDMILPAHGPFTDRPGQLLQHYIDHRTEREKNVLNALGDRSKKNLDDLLPIVYDDVEKDLWKFARRSLLAHLLKLKKEDRVRQTDEGWLLSSGTEN